MQVTYLAPYQAPLCALLARVAFTQLRVPAHARNVKPVAAMRTQILLLSARPAWPADTLQQGRFQQESKAASTARRVERTRLARISIPTVSSASKASTHRPDRLNAETAQRVRTMTSQGGTPSARPALRGLSLRHKLHLALSVPREKPTTTEIPARRVNFVGPASTPLQARARWIRMTPPTPALLGRDVKIAQLASTMMTPLQQLRARHALSARCSLEWHISPA
jgi:hypothetical protein